MTNLQTATQVATQLGISARRVRALAISRRLGERIGPLWVFSERDIENMRVRVNGRPPKTSGSLAHRKLHGGLRKKRLFGPYSSMYKYVYWRKDRQKWMAMPPSSLNGERRSIGFFQEEVDAWQAVEAFLAAQAI